MTTRLLIRRSDVPHSSGEKLWTYVNAGDVHVFKHLTGGDIGIVESRLQELKSVTAMHGIEVVKDEGSPA